jgi:TolB protein
MKLKPSAAPNPIYNAELPISSGRSCNHRRTFMRKWVVSPLASLYISMRWLVMLTCSLALVFAATPSGAAQTASAPLGIFEAHGDVGTVLHPGSVDYDGAKGTYTIAGSGENMWSTTDAFQFVWKKISGDVTLTADISFATGTGNEHKKAVLILRQSLDADSIYADIALHASGLTSLQFRDEKGALTREIESNLSAPKRLRIVRRGDYVYMALAADGGEPKVAGGWLRIPLQGTFYVGLGVCSHDKDVVEKAVFSNVDLGTPSSPAGQPTLYSTLETVTIDSADRRVAYLAQGHFEAPNWTRDGIAFFFNQDGHIERLPVSGGNPEKIDTGFATRCNNDHGISPDGTELAISDNSQEENNSLVYIVPIGGGTPRRITQKSPSYWHGWSPDGKTLAFVGQRNGDFDIYTIPAAGGVAAQETRLTTAKGLDDGPEYSPDGKYIYFNSERTGHMQIWRMKPDGSAQEQVFSDDLNNWFPHISPDGHWMVFLTYEADVTGHPGNKDVMLRLMPLGDENAKKIAVLARLFGGQGTMNVPSWSPDSKRVAFVSYMLVPEEKFSK